MNALRKQLVVVAGTAPVPGETFIARDLEALRRNGWNIVCFGLDRRADAAGPAVGVSLKLAGALLRRLCTLWRRPQQALALLRAWRLVGRVANAARQADVILAHFAWLTADVAAVAAAVSGRPWICAVHAWDVFAHPHASLRAHLRGAAQVVACSEAARQAVVAAGYPEASIARVHHGLPLADYPCRAEQPETGRVIVAVGRLARKKGFDQLLRALALLPEDRRGGLQVVGDGWERARLEALAGELGLSDIVRFLGRLDPAETRRLMQSAALLVLPSRRLPNGDRDGIANVLLEAMALGVPVVTTTAGAAGEIIADHRNGILVPADDERSLSEAIGSLLADRPLRERLALAARATVEAQFDLRCTGAALSDVLASHVSVPASNASRQPAP
jgi:colanic acid/amylovoran biosynthesis glycosyltransferase